MLQTRHVTVREGILLKWKKQTQSKIKDDDKWGNSTNILQLGSQTIDSNLYKKKIN